MIKLSIIICTYNRSGILKYCLDSLIDQSIDQSSYEVIVVDNNSTDDTKAIVNSYENKILNLRYICEDQIGLSYARNAGYKNANSGWIAYIDDDAIAHKNYAERAIKTFESYNFDCFGGKYYPWFLYPRKKWLPKDIGLKKDIISVVGIINEWYATGCNMLFKKAILEKFNGFNFNLGMTGNKVAYGEETELQDRIRVSGGKIGYDPELKVDHLVGKHKLTLKWHLKSAYAYGRDNYRMWGKGKPDIIYVIKTIFKSTSGLLPKLLRSAKSHDYYWQNVVLDTFKPIYQAFGEYHEFRKSK